MTDDVVPSHVPTRTPTRPNIVPLFTAADVDDDDPVSDGTPLLAVPRLPIHTEGPESVENGRDQDH